MAQKERMEQYHAIIKKCLKLSTTIIEIIEENVQPIELNDGDSLTISKCNLTILLRQEKIYSELQAISEIFKDISNDYEENMEGSNRLINNIRFNKLNIAAIFNASITESLAKEIKYYDLPDIDAFTPIEIKGKEYKTTIDDLGEHKTILYSTAENECLVCLKQYTPYELLRILNTLISCCSNAIGSRETD